LRGISEGRAARRLDWRVHGCGFGESSCARALQRGAAALG
jgi:hypothetical protein